MHEELRQHLDSRPEPEPPPGGWKVPEFTWGDALFRMRVTPRGEDGRRFGRRIGRDRLAAQISQVERCTRRDIEKVETATTLPDEPHLRRVAMCFAVAMWIDPIYMRHVMGLVRWDCHIELDELRIINPGWVELVEQMNRQLEERPPRWVVEGER